MMKNIFRQKNLVSPREREEVFGTKGAVIWLTGLSGSGKSTVAVLTERALFEKRLRTYLLDADNLRFGLNADLGFSDADRTENIRRLSHTAALFAHSGTVALVSAISPFEKDRRAAAEAAKAMGVPFLEVFVDTPLAECIRRDTKGLYQKALAGEIKHFTGISAPYETPMEPDMRLTTTDCTPAEAAAVLTQTILLLQNLKEMTAKLCAVAIQAGKEIMQVYEGDFSVYEKADASPLTDADLRSNATIVSFLEETYPSFAVLSEEKKDTHERLQNPFCFVVDPLDGTKEFVKRNGEFTVNIGLSLFGKSVLGVVYAPVAGTLWYAAKGCGAYKQTTVDALFQDENRIFVSDRTEALVVMASRSHADEKLTALLERNAARIGETRSAGSSLKGCYIADGTADIYYRTGFTMEWDTCAMQCVVEEAGGVFRQGDSSPMRYNREDSLNRLGFYILNHPENSFE